MVEDIQELLDRLSSLCWMCWMDEIFAITSVIVSTILQLDTVVPMQLICLLGIIWCYIKFVLPLISKLMIFKRVRISNRLLRQYWSLDSFNTFLFYMFCFGWDEAAKKKSWAAEAGAIPLLMLTASLLAHSSHKGTRVTQILLFALQIWKTCLLSQWNAVR